MARRPIPQLTDEQINSLIERSLGTPEAESIGLIRHPDEDYPYGRYVFTKQHRYGDRDAGDVVTPANFRDAMQAVIDARGNLGEDRAAVSAYWDMVKRPHSEWSAASILAIASMAPLQGVLEQLAQTQDEDNGKEEEA